MAHSRFETSLFEAARHEVSKRPGKDVEREKLFRIKTQDKLFLSIVIELGVCFSFLHICEILCAACSCKSWAAAARAFFANARRVSISVPGGGGSAATEATVRRVIAKLALCETVDLSSCINVNGSTLRHLVPACGPSLRNVDISWCDGVSAKSVHDHLVGQSERLLPCLSSITARGVHFHGCQSESVNSVSRKIDFGANMSSRRCIVQHGFPDCNFDSSVVQLCVGSCELFEAGGEVWRSCTCARDTSYVDNSAKAEESLGASKAASARRTSFLMRPQCEFTGACLRHSTANIAVSNFFGIHDFPNATQTNMSSRWL